MPARRSLDHNTGTTWRVGIKAPNSQQAPKDNGLQAGRGLPKYTQLEQLLRKGAGGDYRAATLQVEPIVDSNDLTADDGLAGMHEVLLHLRRPEAVIGSLEVDASGTIVKAGLNGINLPGGLRAELARKCSVMSDCKQGWQLVQAAALYFADQNKGWCCCAMACHSIQCLNLLQAASLACPHRTCSGSH